MDANPTLDQLQVFVAVAETLPQGRLIFHPDYPDRPDPHIWFDPVLWGRVTEAMEPVLAGFAPDVAARAAAYRAEHQRYLALTGKQSVQTAATQPSRDGRGG